MWHVESSFFNNSESEQQRALVSCHVSSKNTLKKPRWESVPRHLMMLCTVATLHRSRHSIISCSLCILRVFPQAQPTTSLGHFLTTWKTFCQIHRARPMAEKQPERGKNCAHDGSHRRHQFLALPTILLRKERRGKKLLIYQRRNKFT